jgi:hypothetical protein
MNITDSRTYSEAPERFAAGSNAITAEPGARPRHIQIRQTSQGAAAWTSVQAGAALGRLENASGVGVAARSARPPVSLAKGATAAAIDPCGALGVNSEPFLATLEFEGAWL